MEKTNEELIHEFALAMYDMPNSLCCSYCTKDKCKHGKDDKSCVGCIMDYWRRKVNEKK